MKRTAHPPLSPLGQEALASYERWLREREDLAAASIRNYLSDLRHFIAWYETGLGQSFPHQLEALLRLGLTAPPHFI